MIARPLTRDLWSVAYERLTPYQALRRARVRATVAAARLETN
jgi:hypothetical protein